MARTATPCWAVRRRSHTPSTGPPSPRPPSPRPRRRIRTSARLALRGDLAEPGSPETPLNAQPPSGPPALPLRRNPPPPPPPPHPAQLLCSPPPPPPPGCAWHTQSSAPSPPPPPPPPSRGCAAPAHHSALRPRPNRPPPPLAVHSTLEPGSRSPHRPHATVVLLANLKRFLSATETNVDWLARNFEPFAPRMRALGISARWPTLSTGSCPAS